MHPTAYNVMREASLAGEGKLDTFAPEDGQHRTNINEALAYLSRSR